MVIKKFKGTGTHIPRKNISIKHNNQHWKVELRELKHIIKGTGIHIKGNGKHICKVENPLYIWI